MHEIFFGASSMKRKKFKISKGFGFRRRVTFGPNFRVELRCIMKHSKRINLGFGFYVAKPRDLSDSV